jgi:hypothetical protein
VDLAVGKSKVVEKTTSIDATLTELQMSIRSFGASLGRTKDKHPEQRRESKARQGTGRERGGNGKGTGRERGGNDLAKQFFDALKKRISGRGRMMIWILIGNFLSVEGRTTEPQ